MARCRSLLLVLVVAAVVVAGGASAAVTRDRSVPKKPPPSQVVVAKQLAARVVAARTPAARYRALLAMMRTLRVGVYTGRGKAIVRGGERNARDFFLYDFELRAIASALARRQTADVEVVREQLAAVGVLRGGNPLAVGELERLLGAAVRRALARPRDRRSLLALLLRELGRRQRPGYDLARGLPAGARFDALQSVLLVADAVVGARGRRLAAASGVSGNASGPEGACWITGKTGPAGGWLGYLGVPHSQDPGEAVMALHAVLLLMAIELDGPVADVQETHYGPTGPGSHRSDAGRPLRFEARAVMNVDLSETEIACGPLSGQRLPAKGPVPYVSVEWQSHLESRPSGPREALEKHGVAIADVATDTDGRATLDFTPENEAVPGFGSELTARGYVAVRLLPPLRLPPQVMERLRQRPGLAWNTWQVAIGYHKPRGFKFSTEVSWFAELCIGGGSAVRAFASLAFPETTSQAACADEARYSVRIAERFRGRACGADPYEARWELVHEAHLSQLGPRNYSVDRELDPATTHGGFRADGSFAKLPYGIGLTAPVQLVFATGPPPTVRLVERFTRDEGVLSLAPSTEQTVTVNVEEDMSCPEND